MYVDDPDNPTVIELLVKALGSEPIRHRNWYLWCGKSACQNVDLPANMMCDLLGTVNDLEADILAMICPTCFGQLDHGQKKAAQQFDKDF